MCGAQCHPTVHCQIPGRWRVAPSYMLADQHCCWFRESCSQELKQKQVCPSGNLTTKLVAPLSPSWVFRASCDGVAVCQSLGKELKGSLVLHVLWLGPSGRNNYCLELFHEDCM